ncbi:MAG TPA: excinuclease ABC subunit UvrA [Planctomicrobium sp.]|nr:excinuclease ABC subunit UvrA [Planctomicrobium sp.]
MPRSFEELTPQNFSFNSPLGWCPACEGLGTELGTDQSAIVANPNLSLREGAISAWPRPASSPMFSAFLEAIGSQFDIPLDLPWYQISARHQRLILQGTGDRWIPVTLPGASRSMSIQYKGIYPAIEEASRVSYPYRARLQDMMGERPCSVCNGDRIREDAAAVRLNDKTLPALCGLPLNEVLDYLKSLKLDKNQKKVAGDLLNEAIHRLSFLIDVGLHYLTLNRGMPTLSGGESQRIRLAGQIGRALTGVLYVLDEPTIGLHPRDNGRLVQALEKLRDLGNTVVLVEHDREVLAAADRLYDFGPGSGRFGGSVIAEGSPKELTKHPHGSLTAEYLSGQKSIPIPLRRRMQLTDEASGPVIDFRQIKEAYGDAPGGAWLEMTGCRQNNLRDVDLRIPLGTLVCITGLSGSGKSSLIQETLARAVARHLRRQGPAPGPHDSLSGVDQISRVIAVDQAPLGATPASNPATYTGVFDPIRELFSKLPESKIRGYKPGRFSFNRAGGRCEDCEGLGQKKIEMHFLPDVWVECETCRGMRYNLETLSVKYKGHSIADVLNMSIGQALEVFDNIPKIRAPLATLVAIGLDYLTLGQSATTLSGGEAQRVKLAAELAKPNAGRTLYLLDEPTTGLHFDDIAKLLKVLNSLVEQGNTAVVIEHNLDVIKTADWVIDLGPEAGIGGGYIVAMGTPEDVVAQALSYSSTASKGTTSRKKSASVSVPTTSTGQPFRSWTGELLAPVLEQDERQEVDLFDVAEAAKKKKGDLDIAAVGRQTAAPWQTDGRAWHTSLRPARNGKSCRWEGEALAFVIDQLEEFDGLKPANWNDQASVEVTAKKKTGTGWFLHALTGDEWLLHFYFRVPKGTFDEEELQRKIRLKSVNDLDELPIYNRSDRVRINKQKGAFQEVVIDAHWLEEINTPEFKQFLKQAVNAYLGKVEQTGQSLENLSPWKVLGKKWHLSRKGFPSSKRVAWSADVLEELFTLLEGFEKIQPDWANKTTVPYRVNGDKGAIVELVTKRRESVALNLHSKTGTHALGEIAQLGNHREIAPYRNGQDRIQIELTAVEQVRDKALKRFLTTFLAGL